MQMFIGDGAKVGSNSNICICRLELLAIVHDFDVQMIRDAFDLAKEKSKDRGGAIIFIDEVDA